MKDARAAGIYVRISDDRLNDAAGVGRQEVDCQAVAGRHGWVVAEVYRENDTSAFKRRKVRLPDGSTALRVVRPEFRRLLADLDSGAIDAVVVYDLDRLARDPRDLEDFIDAVEHRQIPTASVTGSLDLSTDAGITMARILGAFNNKSSRDSARRVSRKHLELAEQGRPGGGGIRPFGYAQNGADIIEAEADTIRWMAEMVLAGDSLRSVTEALDTYGVKPVRAGRWNARSVHSALAKPRVAGLREYRGEIVGQATWDAILDRDTWERVLVALDGRRRNANNVLQQWLTGVIVCGKCGADLESAGARSHKLYRCPPKSGGRGCGGMNARAELVEEVAEGLILGYLSRPDVLTDLRAATGAEAVQQARTDLAADEEQLRELAGMWAKRTITTAEYMAARKQIEERADRARRIVSAALPGGVRHLLQADDIKARWKSLQPAERRDVARVVFTEGLTLKPAVRPPGARWSWNPRRVVPNGWNQ